MDIKTYRRDYGKDFVEFDICIKTDNTTTETTLSEKDVFEVAVSFLEDTVLHNCWQNEVVGKLIEAGVISKEQVLEYVDELGETYNG